MIVSEFNYPMCYLFILGEWKDRVACQSKLEFSQKTANLNSNLGTAGVSIGGVAGVFLPHVSTSLWLFI